MLNCTIKYADNPKGLENSRGANQGEWIIATSDSPIFYIASKDASPCVLVFIQGKNVETNTTYGCVAHISVAERIDSLDEMLEAMEIDWSTASAFLISGKSDLRTPLCADIYDLIASKIPPEKIQIDLGNKTTNVVMDIRTAMLYKESIPSENYPFFNPETYFRAACVGIFFPEKKRSLINTFDSREKDQYSHILLGNL